MKSRRLIVIALLGLSIAGCSSATAQPTISFNGQGCTSSDTADWPDGGLNIEVSNNSDSPTAVVMGTYDDGFGHDDLGAYGSDISIRPPFIEALEIFDVPRKSTRTLSFDHGLGTYFMICMPDTNTMIVLDDVTVED